MSRLLTAASDMRRDLFVWRGCTAVLRIHSSNMVLWMLDAARWMPAEIDANIRTEQDIVGTHNMWEESAHECMQCQCTHEVAHSADVGCCIIVVVS